MPSAPTFFVGHVKRDADSNSVALRTMFPEDQGPQLANMAWLVSTPNMGARHAATAEVTGWSDLFVAPDPEAS